MNTDPRQAMITALLEKVPSGYFATQLEGGARIDFLRISRPKPDHKWYGGAIKIQTQHSDVLSLAGVVWPLPDGRFQIYKPNIIEILMTLVSDYRTCALRYSTELGRCCRCNKDLTDARSRHYGIGPICDQIWTWMIELVDDQHDGKSFDQLTYEARV